MIPLGMFLHLDSCPIGIIAVRRVILESPFAGDVGRHIDYARACVRDALLRGDAPVASHLLYTQPGVLNDDVPAERQHGIDAGLVWRTVAEASVVYTDLGISRGMAYGIAAARQSGVPVEYRSLNPLSKDPKVPGPSSFSRIWLDLDGVFADFFPVAKRILGCEYREMPAAEAWAKLEQIPRLYRDLPMIPGSRALYEALAPLGDRVAILGALPKPTGFLAAAEFDKRQWVACHLSATLRAKFIEGGANKASLAGPGDILIDDTERNIRLWEAAGGIGILHTSAEASIARLRELGVL